MKKGIKKNTSRGDDSGALAVGIVDGGHLLIV